MHKLTAEFIFHLSSATGIPHGPSSLSSACQRRIAPGDHLMPTVLLAHNEPSKVTAGDC